VLNNEKVLVLGANGFLGSYVVDSLVEKGYNVRAFGSFTDDEIRFNKSDLVEIFPGNFLNRSDIASALKDIDYVFHLVSTTNPATAEADPLVDIETNIQASVSLFQECIKQGKTKRVIYPSSGGTVYGERDGSVPIREEEPLMPVSPYGIGKVTIENYLRYFKVKHGLDSTIFRIANPYGERQPKFRKQGVIPIFLEKAIRNEPLTVLGDGSMVRDYVYVKDVAEMMTSILKVKPLHDVYNLGSGSGNSLQEILKVIETVTGKSLEVEYKEAPKTFIHTSVLSTDRFFNEFGRWDMVPLEEGIKRTYEYLINTVEGSN
jgi:UDP-glucose 4-epimerase